jgi:hypothetical protein
MLLGSCAGHLLLPSSRSPLCPATLHGWSPTWGGLRA